MRLERRSPGERTAIDLLHRAHDRWRSSPAKGGGRKASRLAALIVASACLGLWAYGLLTYEGGEGALAPLVDNFYATEYLQTQLGPLWSGVLVGRPGA